MTRLLRCLSALACCLPALLAAQTPPSERPAQVWIAPESGNEPVRLNEVAIQIHAQGFVARTMIDLSFHNPNPRVLEGEFVFPLGAGQSVAGYALEVEGAMREGVVVDKQTARVAFEDVIRQQIDPGLAELTAGNVFRTRLYPIPARGNKRVRLHLLSTLVDAGDSWRYLLPLHFDEKVERFSVRAQAQLSEQAPIADALSADSSLRFERSATHWVSEYSGTDVQPQRELAFRIPKADGPRQIEAVDLIDPAWRSVIAQIDSGMPTDPGASAKPRRIALYYDASGSALERQRDRESAALRAYLGQLGNVEVLLFAFRNDADPVQRHVIRNGDATALWAAIEALPLDGGSSYGAIDLGQLRGIDQVLIIGDGLSNFGPAEAQLADAHGRRPPVHVLLASQKADHSRLQRLARSGGGRVIDLAQSSAEEAARLLLQRSWRLLDASSRQGQCEMISPQPPQPVKQRITVHARCRGKAELVLGFGLGEGERVERIIRSGLAEPVQAELTEPVHQLWAQAWIGELNQVAKVDQDAIDELGKRFGLVTAGTSLLVLDRIEDYVRYRVEPKEAALKAEYRRLLAQAPKLEPDPGREARIEDLLRRWHEFRDYHARDYPGVESVLLPMTQTELAAWPQEGGDKAWRRGRSEAKALHERALQLLARWPQDGAEATSRSRWEREAAQLVFALEALRQRRGELPLLADKANASTPVMPSAEAEDWVDAEPLYDRARPASAPPPPPPPTPVPQEIRDAAVEDLRHAQVTGSRLALQEQDAASDDDSPTPLSARIELSGWNPDVPYLEPLRTAKDPYLVYLKLRADYASTPTFYLDVADFLRSEAKLERLALRVLSNLAELETENTALVRVLGYRLAQWEAHALAVPQFELARRQRPEEPQSHRDLALALARQQAPDRSRAVELLWHVASGDWHGRFPDIELIALHELNDILVQAGEREVDPAAIGIDPRLLAPVAVGLRVVLGWDADNTDIDLWVVDPSGQKAYYGEPRTPTGGHVSRDFTEGYGPEVYSIRRPLPGTYVVLANYYGDRRQSLTGPVSVQLEFQTRFGSVGGERVAVTRRLEGDSETIEIGRFKVGAVPVASSGSQ